LALPPAEKKGSPPFESAVFTPPIYMGPPKGCRLFLAKDPPGPQAGNKKTPPLGPGDPHRGQGEKKKGGPKGKTHLGPLPKIRPPGVLTPERFPPEKELDPLGDKARKTPGPQRRYTTHPEVTRPKGKPKATPF